MIFLGVAATIFIPLAFIGVMAWLVSSLPGKLSFWSTFVTYVLLVFTTVGIFTSVVWLVLVLGWTR